MWGPILAQCRTGNVYRSHTGPVPILFRDTEKPATGVLQSSGGKYWLSAELVTGIDLIPGQYRSCSGTLKTLLQGSYSHLGGNTGSVPNW
jgi:hypothetical protein